MNNKVKWIAPLVLGCLVLNPTPVRAISTEAPTEFASMIASYTNKIGQTFNFMSIITQVTTFTDTMGDAGINAASSLLGSTSGLMGPFQDSLHFTSPSALSGLMTDGVGSISDVGNIAGASDMLGGAQDALNSVKNSDAVKGLTDAAGSIKNTVNDAQGKLSSVSSEIKGNVENVVGSAEGQTSGLVQNAQGQLSSAGTNVQDKLKEVADGNKEQAATQSGTSEKEKTSGDTTAAENSALARVNVPTGVYGAPQKTKEAALKYVHDTFYYSTKEGDKFEGEQLTAAQQAHEQVQKNRMNYYKEIISTSYGSATEHAKTNTELSQQRLDEMNKLASSSETFDDKKSATAVIVQNQIRERMIKLSLDLANLELNTVQDIMAEPANVVIARSAEQIRQETEKNLEQADYNQKPDEVKREK